MAKALPGDAVLKFQQVRGGQARVEIEVPAGTTLEASQKLEALIYAEIAPEILNIAACSNCRSGLDVIVRERFEDIIRVDLGSFKVQR